MSKERSTSSIVNEIVGRGVEAYNNFIRGKSRPNWEAYEREIKNIYGSYAHGTLPEFQKAVAKIVRGDKGDYKNSTGIDEVMGGNYGFATQASIDPANKKAVSNFVQIAEKVNPEAAETYAKGLNPIQKAVVVKDVPAIKQINGAFEDTIKNTLVDLCRSR